MPRKQRSVLPEGSCARDTQAIPYRLTAAYRAAVATAARQREGLRFRREALWPSEAGQRTSAFMRSGRGVAFSHG